MAGTTSKGLKQRRKSPFFVSCPTTRTGQDFCLTKAFQRTNLTSSWNSERKACSLRLSENQFSWRKRPFSLYFINFSLAIGQYGRPRQCTEICRQPTYSPKRECSRSQLSAFPFWMKNKSLHQLDRGNYFTCLLKIN